MNINICGLQTIKNVIFVRKIFSRCCGTRIRVEMSSGRSRRDDRKGGGRGGGGGGGGNRNRYRYAFLLRSQVAFVQNKKKFNVE